MVEDEEPEGLSDYIPKTFLASNIKNNPKLRTVLAEGAWL